MAIELEQPRQPTLSNSIRTQKRPPMPRSAREGYSDATTEAAKPLAHNSSEVGDPRISEFFHPTQSVLFRGDHHRFDRQSGVSCPFFQPVALTNFDPWISIEWFYLRYLASICWHYFRFIVQLYHKS